MGTYIKVVRWTSLIGLLNLIGHLHSSGMCGPKDEPQKGIMSIEEIGLRTQNLLKCLRCKSQTGRGDLYEYLRRKRIFTSIMNKINHMSYCLNLGWLVHRHRQQ